MQPDKITHALAGAAIAAALLPWGVIPALLAVVVAPSADVDFSPVSLVVENVGYSAGGTPCALIDSSGGFMAVYQQSVGGPVSAVGLSPASGLYISGSYLVG